MVLQAHQEVKDQLAPLDLQGLKEQRVPQDRQGHKGQLVQLEHLGHLDPWEQQDLVDQVAHLALEELLVNLAKQELLELPAHRE